MHPRHRGFPSGITRRNHAKLRSFAKLIGAASDSPLALHTSVEPATQGQIGNARPARVLFLCTHNSARSQMAEGLLRALGAGEYEVFSAGTEASSVHPEAIAVMGEIGVDISGYESKLLDRYLDLPFDKVITVCDDANESCPVFFGARERLHWSFPDPSRATGNDTERLLVFRDVRNAIRKRIETELLN